MVVDYSQIEHDELLVCPSHFWKRNDVFSSNSEALENISKRKYRSIGIIKLSDVPSLAEEVEKTFKALESYSKATNMNFNVYGGRASNTFYFLNPKQLDKWSPDWKRELGIDTNTI